MIDPVLKLHPKDNIITALEDLPKGMVLSKDNSKTVLEEDIPVKHKFTIQDLDEGDLVYMYGVQVGKTSKKIAKGSLVHTDNLIHSAEPYTTKASHTKEWLAPDISNWNNRTFNGYLREDGSVGVANIWLVIPLVFCENRNINVLKKSLAENLGYTTDQDYQVDIQLLINKYKEGANKDAVLDSDIIKSKEEIVENRLFENVDGIKFLTHQGGCGSSKGDTEALCQLLAGYITNPNVAGATVLSLGCEHAQITILEKAIRTRDPNFNKPLYVLGQQKSKSERDFIAEAVKASFVGLMQANQIIRQPAPLNKLIVGLECGGSDGFSGISANPALGYASDLIVSLGGSAILSEFPELNGVEQELINRCIDNGTAEKFAALMQKYEKWAAAVGSGFDQNPSPGNIKEGLITGAIKSAGAARKGGTSPITDVLDYTEKVKKPGLNLLCTPGNDVESTTGLAASGANIIVFTTGLGTPTGNPVAPTIKVSSNTQLYEKMPDIIDINAGTIISGEDSIESKGEEILEYIIKVANGEVFPHAVRLGQDDFIPWKRGVSL